MGNETGTEVLELIEMLYTMVTEAWGVPLGNERCIVDRDRLLNLLDEIKARLPAEMAEAKRLVNARDEFIGNAKREADSIRRSAEERAKELLEEQEIVRASKARSNEMLSAAESRTRELYRVANEYVDDVLRRTEEAINAALSEVRQSRVHFRSAVGGAAKSQQTQPTRVTRISESELEE